MLRKIAKPKRHSVYIIRPWLQERESPAAVFSDPNPKRFVWTAERMNKTIAVMLCVYADVEHKTWVGILPCVTFAYNTEPQKTTRMTPFRVLYGHDVVTMLDAMLAHIENTGDCCAEEIMQRAEDAKLARVRIRPHQVRISAQATTICTTVTRNSRKVMKCG
ncbi:hypothetical protein HPB48_023611 [Haemaphysalis longicornis]|uniref:Uncharacterized protein n=1 Tax=Haemaphysalis longicornis TaxID=44386 RepID=A0A9J6H5H5_HAELO|nr:hypothetical protein HPB48_023611 [Haemaphysalis longicornis]